MYRIHPFTQGISIGYYMSQATDNNKGLSYHKHALWHSAQHIKGKVFFFFLFLTKKGQIPPFSLLKSHASIENSMIKHEEDSRAQTP